MILQENNFDYKEHSFVCIRVKHDCVVDEMPKISSFSQVTKMLQSHVPFVQGIPWVLSSRLVCLFHLFGYLLRQRV